MSPAGKNRRGLVSDRKSAPVRPGHPGPGSRAVPAGRPAAAAQSAACPPTVVWKPVLTDSAPFGRHATGQRRPACIGVIAWMHTFSPAKMWISGLDALRKPLLHLHTQLNASLPWQSIDMDFMNLNQSAHGDREFGFIQTRLGVARKTVAGHVSDPDVVARIDAWARAAAGVAHLRALRLARFGDNMRDVAVTEGDKVEAELRFGVSVNTYGVNDLVEVVDAVPDATVEDVVQDYLASYRVEAALLPGRRAVRVAALRGPARRRADRVPRRRRFRGVHDELRGSRRPAPTARRGRAAVDGAGRRVRRGGRLEDLDAARGGEADGARAARRHLVHGGLHVPLRPGHARRFWARTCSRCARRSRPSSRPARCIRSRSATARIRCGWCSTRRRAQR